VLEPARVRALHALPSLATRRAAAEPNSAPSADPLERQLLSRWPHSVPVTELDVSPAGSLPIEGRASPSVEQRVVELYAAGRVDLRSSTVGVAVAAGERPQAFGAARWINREHVVIPSLHHESLRFQDPLGRRLLALLDGTRTRDELCAALGAPFDGPIGRSRLDGALGVLASKALLVG
jgi:hypothetical protein